MGWMNECKKCRKAVPADVVCPHCGRKLAKTNEYLAFWVYRVPLRDWFAWNHVLRVALPVLALVTVLTLWIEGAIGGDQGIRSLFFQGFLEVLLSVLAGILLVMLLLFSFQGKESVCYRLDKAGVQTYTYLRQPSRRVLLSRFLTRRTLLPLQKEEWALQGHVLVKRSVIAWADVKRVRFWRENKQILFFRPAWWQAMVITCPPAEFVQTEAFVRKKMGKDGQKKIRP